MTVELTVQELALIEQWYHAAAGESMSGSYYPEELPVLKSVLRKFGFAAHVGDVDAIQSENGPNVRGPA